ncbi:hypothetical protein BGX34_006675 [Mortierella sp. NVP85]|nr:hypothetical protein BGX34_006675 [Mortierella sp. NVP85]
MISKPRSIKGPWTPEEDRQLRALVNELGAEKWVLIASRLGSRTGKQCRERWHNHLDPTIDKSPFTPEENELILSLHEKMGSKWAEMSKLMPGRPDNAIKNHFNTSMQRQRRRLSLQDPSELQMKFTEGPAPSTSVASPLPSPTSTTTPSTARGHRFDPYERRHSMPCLGMPEKTQGQTATDNQQEATPLSSRSALTPPKTPDAKWRQQFSSGMSRSSSLGSASRGNSGQGRPSLLVSPSIHKGSNPYFVSTSSAMSPSRSSSSPLSPNFPGKLARASSAMSLSSAYSGRQSPYSGCSGEQGYGYYQQEQQLHHSLPRPNLTRHESLRRPPRHHNYSRSVHHEHHRSLDANPFSALAELANVAEQHRDMRTTTATVAPAREDMEEDHDEMSMTSKSASAASTRRFPTLLSNLKEEDHSEDHGHGLRRAQHSYHIDQRSETSHFHGRPGLHGRSSSSPTPSRPLMSSFYRTEHGSMDYSASENGGSDRERERESSKDRDYRMHASPEPSATLLAMRRGSVRELMAIDNLCLSSEELDRCS